MNTKPKKSRIKVASLFCGCGGSDLGTVGGVSYLGRRYAKLPFDIVYAADFDKDAIATYNANFRTQAVCRDVCFVDTNSDVPDFDVLIGGFPCQSFSTLNPTKDTNDARAHLYKQIVRFLHDKHPKAFVCENVKGLLVLQKGDIIHRIVDEFAAEGYRVQYRLLHAADYGIPQRRERLFIVGVRNDIGPDYSYPERTTPFPKWVPLRKVVPSAELPVDKKYYFSQKAVQGMKNAKPNMKRGLWQNLNEPCLTITSHLAKASINSRDPILLVDKDKELYRRFTPREAAGIQSFPSSFVFPGSDQKSFRQIGNAVPPVLMWYVMRALGRVLSKGNHPQRARQAPNQQ